MILRDLFTAVQTRNDNPRRVMYNTSEIEPLMDLEAQQLGDGQIIVCDEDFGWQQLERLIYTNAYGPVEPGHFVWHNDYRWDFRSEELRVIPRTVRRGGGKLARGVVKNNNQTNCYSAYWPSIAGVGPTGVLSVHPTVEGARKEVAFWEITCLGADLDMLVQMRDEAAVRKQDSRAIWRRHAKGILDQSKMNGISLAETVNYLVDRATDNLNHISEIREYRERLLAELQEAWQLEYKTKPNINLDSLT